jgi:hypothetical protein
MLELTAAGAILTLVMAAYVAGIRQLHTMARMFTMENRCVLVLDAPAECLAAEPAPTADRAAEILRRELDKAQLGARAGAVQVCRRQGDRWTMCILDRRGHRLAYAEAPIR